MSGSKDTTRREMIRHLKIRGALSGGILFAARTPRADEGERSEVAETAEIPAGEGIVIETSPVRPAKKSEAQLRSADPPGPAMPAREGITRDTRPSSQAALFGGPDDDGPDTSGLDLNGLERMVAGCTLCGLHSSRTNTVFGDGSSSAGLLFVGEAPGKDEDLQGVPFVGRAGKLLDRMIAAIGFSREEVYIANILKCRPPGNRDPKEDEVSSCEIYLARQIELIGPAVICALGRIAGQNLLGTKAALHALRGAVHRYNGIPVIVTYHPAALLRNPHWKQAAWDDLKMLRSLYDGITGAKG